MKFILGRVIDSKKNHNTIALETLNIFMKKEMQTVIIKAREVLVGTLHKMFLRFALILFIVNTIENIAC